MTTKLTSQLDRARAITEIITADYIPMADSEFKVWVDEAAAAVESSYPVTVGFADGFAAALAFFHKVFALGASVHVAETLGGAVAAKLYHAADAEALDALALDLDAMASLDVSADGTVAFTDAAGQLGASVHRFLAPYLVADPTAVEVEA